MSFREELMTDLDEVFFELEEFAEEHRVEGQTIVCIIDSALNPKDAEYGLSSSNIVLRAKTADLPLRKSAGALLNLDGRDYTVGAWADVGGVTVIDLFSPEVA